MNKMHKQLDVVSLENWFLKNQRKLPFRNTKNPYAIWISEIMLQQTKMDTVIPYYNQFMKKYPTVFALSKTTQEDLLKTVEGIGYYRRFKLMLEAAQVIVKNYQGIFPSTYKDILNLPGIGKYTAGAIMSIAYNKPYAATDGNVVRVLSRIYNISKDMRIESNKTKIHELNQSLIETANPNIYTESLMELGALICLSNNPLCKTCPINHSCLAFEHHLENKLPIISKLPKKNTYNYICLIIHKDNQIFLRKRTESLLEGMYEYPQILASSFKHAKQQLQIEGIEVNLLSKEKTYKHIFTHQKWLIDVYHVSLISKGKTDWILVDMKDISKYPMAKAHRQIQI
ncbi:A/G-specific adenine glycosylase [Candidatus Izemoplasma sp. B36]|uniref:A/G-specific adenine glycosylase n=1 Tax=Candidatus Izemoplasma sp. B36 TaxID=3242468 RepID=UPI0035570217